MQWLEISRAALRHNLSVAKALAPQQQCWPCVKANAYGHGLAEVVSAIDDLADGYCVVSTGEALALRRLTEKFIFVLNIVDPEEIADCVGAGIVLPLASREQEREYARLGMPVRVHLEIDSGMARTGFKWDSPAEMLAYVGSLPEHIKIEGLWSHYAAAGENDSFTREQYERFAQFVRAYRDAFGEITVHLDKSASILLDNYRWSDDWRQAYRLGIATYGYDPQWPGAQRLMPALSWKTKVISCRPLAKDEPVGYGLTFTSEKDTYIATIPVGYADGYARSFSNVGSVLIRGVRCPIRGRICMNLTMVEVPSTVEVGDEVVLIGSQGDDELTAFELADWIKTTHYEIVTRLHPEIPRLRV